MQRKDKEHLKTRPIPHPNLLSVYTVALMSLYRDYRPKTFADVVGQDHIVSTLLQAQKQGKLSHAYLFSGPRGTGKTSIARILARTLLTDGIEDPVLRRQIDDAVDDGTLVDLIEIDAASNRGIDDMRGLLEKLQFTPAVSHAKVHIIDEVHMLTKESFNALLKTLEEPPSYAFFILATTELHKVPGTIQSRCQRFQFHQIPEEEIVQRLQWVADQEKIVADRAALRAIAHHVGGGMRDALSLLDQVRSLPQITLAEVEERIGGNGEEFAEALAQALDTGDDAAILATVARIEERALPMEQIVRSLLNRERTALHTAVIEKTDTAIHLQRLETLIQALRDMRSAPVQALVLETSLLSLLPGATQKQHAPSPAPAVIRSQPAAQKTIAEKPQDKAPEPPKAQPEPTPERTATVDAPELSLAAIQKEWIQVTRELNAPSVRMSLKDGTVRALDGSVITLAFSSNFHKSKVAAVDASRLVEERLQAFFHHPLKIKCVLEAEEAKPAASDESMVSLAEAAAEIF